MARGRVPRRRHSGFGANDRARRRGAAATVGGQKETRRAISRAMGEEVGPGDATRGAMPRGAASVGPLKMGLADSRTRRMSRCEWKTTTTTMELTAMPSQSGKRATQTITIVMAKKDMPTPKEDWRRSRRDRQK